MNEFHPHGQDQPCIDCEHWGGWDGSGNYTVCLYDNDVRIKQNPAAGCAMWTRAIGADDNAESPKIKEWGRYGKPSPYR